MATLQEEFEQAAAASQVQTDRPDDPAHPVRKRLRELHRQATEGAPEA